MLVALWLALVACAPTGVDPAHLAAEAVAPPGALQISSVMAGSPTVVSIRGLNPGDRVRFYASATGPGAGPCGFAGTPCLGITNPVDLGAVNANARGVAALHAHTPGQATTLWIQSMRIWPVNDVVSPVLEVQIVDPDADADGLSDREEAVAGTDPAQPDSDADTLSDGDEVHQHHTDPLRADTDGDLASDAREVALGLNPTRPDMDGDTIRDGLDLRPRVVDVPDTFRVDDVLATAAGVDLPDPEFEPTAGYAVWQDAAGAAVWLAQVDPQNGLLTPSHGRGTLLDQHVGPMSIGRNGPEWALSDGGPQALWTRLTGATLSLARAVQVGGAWQTSDVAGSLGQATPIGSLDLGDPAPRTLFFTTPAFGAPNTGWRELDDAATTENTPQFYQFVRWSEGERVVTGVHPDASGVTQVFAFDTATHSEAQLTTSPEAKGSTFFWLAPEFGDERIMFTTHGDADGHPTSIVVYRQIAGTWTPTLTIPMPPGLPYVVSPEPFTYNGRSYVSYISSNKPLNSDNGEAVVWIATVDPTAPFMRRISQATSVVRKDPESYTGGARPFVYYTLADGGRSRLRRCELGL